MLAAIVAAIALAAGAALSTLVHVNFEGLYFAGVLFVLMVAYQGVRLGRSTHIVDMTDEGKRAAYTALSNTVVGVLLMGGGLFGLIAQLAGEASVLALFALMSIAAAFAAHGLEEVQD